MQTLRLAATLLLLAAVTACAPGPASGPVVALEPSARLVRVNETLTVSIQAEGFTDLIAFEAHLWFDPAVLEVVEVIDGTFIAPDFIVENAFDNAAGTVDYATAQINRPPASGDGTLFTIVFRARGEGESPLLFRGTSAAPAGALLADSTGAVISVSLVDGGVKVRQP